MASAAEIIQRVRDNTGLYDESVVFNGYATDRKPKGNRVLPLLNQGLKIYEDTGFNVCEFVVPLVAGQIEYLLDKEILRVTAQAAYNTTTERYFDMVWTDKNRLDSLYGSQWRSRNMTIPMECYSIGTRGIGLSAIPTAESAVYELHLTATSTVNPMAVAADVPGQIINADGDVVVDDFGVPKSALPEPYHWSLAHYAGWILAGRMGDTFTANVERESWEKSLTDLRGLANTRAENGIRRLFVNRGAYFYRPVRGAR